MCVYLAVAEEMSGISENIKRLSLTQTIAPPRQGRQAAIFVLPGSRCLFVAVCFHVPVTVHEPDSSQAGCNDVESHPESLRLFCKDSCFKQGPLKYYTGCQRIACNASF